MSITSSPTPVSARASALLSSVSSSPLSASGSNSTFSVSTVFSFLRCVADATVVVVVADVVVCVFSTNVSSSASLLSANRVISPTISGCEKIFVAAFVVIVGSDGGFASDCSANVNGFLSAPNGSSSSLSLSLSLSSNKFSFFFGFVGCVVLMAADTNASSSSALCNVVVVVCCGADVFMSSLCSSVVAVNNELERPVSSSSITNFFLVRFRRAVRAIVALFIVAD
mmetsp:Transcript_26322/g.43034  ORF Transcript_26322/g.43034 Transcript_26322/m.43034 type:complete len:226 (+) Transcript_26322:501-1178(+)